MIYTMEISDWNGTTCQIKLDLPFFNNIRPWNSTWQVQTEGGLRYRSGGLSIRRCTTPNMGTLMRFVRGVNDYWEWGMEVYGFVNGGDYYYYESRNTSGSGTLHQPWTIGLKEGPISWILVD